MVFFKVRNRQTDDVEITNISIRKDISVSCVLEDMSDWNSLNLRNEYNFDVLKWSKFHIYRRNWLIEVKSLMNNASKSAHTLNNNNFFTKLIISYILMFVFIIFSQITKFAVFKSAILQINNNTKDFLIIDSQYRRIDILNISNTLESFGYTTNRFDDLVNSSSIYDRFDTAILFINYDPVEIITINKLKNLNLKNLIVNIENSDCPQYCSKDFFLNCVCCNLINSKSSYDALLILESCYLIVDNYLFIKFHTFRYLM